MRNPLEGYVASGGTYGRLQPVAGEGLYLKSDVLGLELRSQRQVGATVLVFRDPITGEEFDGALAESERRRRAADERVRELEKQLQSPTAHRPPPEPAP